MKHRISFVWIAALAAFLLPRPAIAAFHLMEMKVHSATHNPNKIIEIDILDPQGRLLGYISYLRDTSENTTVVLTDTTNADFFINAIENYFVQALDLSISEIVLE